MCCQYFHRNYKSYVSRKLHRTVFCTVFELMNWKSRFALDFDYFTGHFFLIIIKLTTQFLIVHRSFTFFLKYDTTNCIAKQFTCPLEFLFIRRSIAKTLHLHERLTADHQEQEILKMVRMIIDQKNKLTQTLINKWQLNERGVQVLLSEK